VLKRWGEMCNIYALMHREAEQDLAIWSKLLVVPSLVLNGVIASVSFATSTRASELIMLTIGTMNVFAGSLALINEALGLTTKREEHIESALLFDKISRAIDSQLTVPKKDRIMDGKEFMRFSGFEADRVLQHKASIPPRIILKFKERYPSFTLSLFELNEIKVYQESTPSDSSSNSSEDMRMLRTSLDGLKKAVHDMAMMVENGERGGAEEDFEEEQYLHNVPGRFDAIELACRGCGNVFSNSLLYEPSSSEQPPV
jgi:hypothetical protein